MQVICLRVSVYELVWSEPLTKNAMSQETGDIKILLLDNIAAFYWLDRATTELSEYAHDTERDAQIGLQQAHACIAAELSKLLKDRRLALIATRHSALSAGGFDR